MLLSSIWLACGTPSAPPAPTPVVAPTLEVAPPWRVERQEEATVWLRLADSPDGVRVDLAPTRDRVPGVTLVERGFVREVAEDGHTWPLVAVSEPDQPLTKAEIRVRGLDLEVHLSGRPIRARSSHPDAPMDPQITWVRIRRLPDDWRVVVQGLATISLPGDGFEVVPAADGALALTTTWGPVTFATTAPWYASALSPARWWLDTGPAVEALEPYPKTDLRIGASPVGVSP